MKDIDLILLSQNLCYKVLFIADIIMEKIV